VRRGWLEQRELCPKTDPSRTARPALHLRLSKQVKGKKKEGDFSPSQPFHDIGRLFLFVLMTFRRSLPG